jgi:uncharacterized protein affecting Mg2+/Co2+ transport
VAAETHERVVGGVDLPGVSLAKAVAVKATFTGSGFCAELSDEKRGLSLRPYSVRVENGLTDRVQLLERYWWIDDRVVAVQTFGEGVLGMRPIIQPGDYFDYSSGVPGRGPHLSMRGAFTFAILTDEKRSPQLQFCEVGNHDFAVAPIPARSLDRETEDGLYIRDAAISRKDARLLADALKEFNAMKDSLLPMVLHVGDIKGLSVAGRKAIRQLMLGYPMYGAGSYFNQEKRVKVRFSVLRKRFTDLDIPDIEVGDVFVTNNRKTSFDVAMARLPDLYDQIHAALSRRYPDRDTRTVAVQAMMRALDGFEQEHGSERDTQVATLGRLKPYTRRAFTEAQLGVR